MPILVSLDHARHRSTRGAPMLAVALLMLVPGLASAAHYVRTFASVVLSGPSQTNTDYIATSEAILTDSWDDPNGDRHTASSGSAVANAGYGSLSVYASVNCSTIWLSGSYTSDSRTWFSDTVTITGGPHGTWGTYSMPVGMAGSYDVALGTNDYVSWGITFPGLDQNGGVGYTLADSANLSQNATATGNFQFGVPFTLYCTLTAKALCYATYAALEIHTSTLQITASMMGINNVRDNGGVLVPGYVVTSESGTNYGNPVPVAPTSWGSVKSLFR